MLARNNRFETALPCRPRTCLTNTLHSNLVQRDIQYPPCGFVSIFHVTWKSLCGHRLVSYQVTYWVGNPMCLHIVPRSSLGSPYKIQFLKNCTTSLNRLRCFIVICCPIQGPVFLTGLLWYHCSSVVLDALLSTTFFLTSL